MSELQHGRDTVCHVTVINMVTDFARHVVPHSIHFVTNPPPRFPFQRIFQCKIAYSNIEPPDTCRCDLRLRDFDNGKCTNWKPKMWINEIPLPT